MAPPEKDEDDDESMEDILQSIKSIIAEDGDEDDASGEDKKEEPEAADEAPKKPKEEKPKAKKADPKKDKEEEIPGSDVLELTEVVEDEEVAEEEKPEDNDILSQIDDAVGTAEEVAAPVETAPPPPPPAAPAAPEPVDAAPGDPSLLADGTVAAVGISVDKLKKSAEPPPLVTTEFPEFVSGHTLEAIVSSMVRPMIKEWLDSNLPDIVERIVEQEIKRITK